MRIAQPVLHLLLADAEPDMTHRLAILFALVRQHVQDQQPPAGFQCSRGFRERALRLRYVMKDQQG